MPLTRTLGVEAADRKAGMTLDELGALVAQAHKAGAAGSEVVEVTTVGWGKVRIKTAKVTITDAGGQEHGETAADLGE